MKVFITIVFTSFFWLLIIFMIVPTTQQPVVEEDSESVAQSIPLPKKVAIEDAIVGVWSPVEIAKEILTISKYGTIKNADRGVTSYSLSGNKMKIDNWDTYVVSVVEEDGGTYLEMKGYDVRSIPVYAGRYRLVKR